MSTDIRKPLLMDHITGVSVTGIVTPSKYGLSAGRIKICACGVKTSNNQCGVCNAEERAGLSLRVYKK